MFTLSIHSSRLYIHVHEFTSQLCVCDCGFLTRKLAKAKLYRHVNIHSTVQALVITSFV